jgi:hypothetical protein
MHTLLHSDLARTIAADRVDRAPRAALPPRRPQPPPLRRRAAHVTARLARRLDHESARRAIA